MPLPTDDLIIWASSDVNLPNLAGPNKVKPIDDLILKGWDFKQKPAADEFNYVLNNMGQYISYLNEDMTYTFSGDVTGSVNSSGSDVNFIISVNDNSHYHTSDTILDATSSATANTIVKRDANGDAAAYNWVGHLKGNADTADKWKTARTLTLNGAVTGSVSVDGSGDISMTTYGTTTTNTGAVTNIRLGTRVSFQVSSTVGTPQYDVGYVLVGATNDGNLEVDTMHTRPLQQYINGVWYTIGNI